MLKCLKHSSWFRLNNQWIWNQTGIELLHEKDALLSLIKTLSDEKRISGSKGVLMITPRYDVSLAILISALTNNNLLNEFLSVVSGFGDMEMLAITNNIQFKSNMVRNLVCEK